MAHVFGPVASRRLGQSLGVNNIPAKHCSDSCVYCQVGPTHRPETTRRMFLPPGDVVQAVERRVKACRAQSRRVDIVTFVPDGEPTLDTGLGAEIEGVKRLGIPVAVITNGSLLRDPGVRAALAAADVVSVKVDAVENRLWRRVNRPFARLDLGTILEGIRQFAGEYRGELLTETMLVGGLNDGDEATRAIAEFLGTLVPSRAYLALPIRPPADPGVLPPTDQAVVRAYEMFRERLPRVELLGVDEEGAFGGTDDPGDDLLAILAVHPMREQEVERYLADRHSGRDLAEDLVRGGWVAWVQYGDAVFLVRRRSGASRGS